MPQQVPEGLDLQPIQAAPEGLDLQPLEQPPQQQGMMSRAWHAISDPLTDASSRFAKSIGDYVDQPVNRDDTYLSGVAARAKGFGAGALQGVGDLVSGLTSPLNLVTTAATMGEAPLMRAGFGGLATVSYTHLTLPTSDL